MRDQRLILGTLAAVLSLSLPSGCMTLEEKAAMKEEHLAEGRTCKGGYAPTGTRIKRCASSDEVRSMSGDAVRHSDRSAGALSDGAGGPGGCITGRGCNPPGTER